MINMYDIACILYRLDTANQIFSEFISNENDHGQNNGQFNGQNNRPFNGQTNGQYRRGPNNVQNNGQFNGQTNGDFDGQYNGQYGRGPNHRGPKRRDTTEFQCLQIGEETDKITDSKGCVQVFDNLATANLACSLFENCLLIGKNSNDNFELFSEADENYAMDLQDYELSIPTMDKSETSLLYGNY